MYIQAVYFTDYHHIQCRHLSPAVGSKRIVKLSNKKTLMHMGKRKSGHPFGMPIQVVGISYNLTEGTYSARAALSRAGSESFDTATAI